MTKMDLKNKLRAFFLSNPTAKMRVRELERKLKLPLPSVIRYCDELQKEGILTVIETGTVRFYAADRSNKNYVLEKKLFNLKNIYHSGIVEHLRKELSNPTVILFGSYAKGEDTEISDIDIFIETPSKTKAVLAKFAMVLNHEIEVIQESSLFDISNKHLVNNIINGITLNGFLEVIK